MNLFSARQVTKQYASHRALDQVSIDVQEGTIFGLLGPNGAGKTTLIRIINQILAPDEGELFFMGRNLHPDDVALIGYLPEERGLYKKMTVGEQAVYLARLKGLSRQEATIRLKHWFEKFEIKGWWNRKVEELSKGMQQKAQFLVTIIHEPRLLIFDEPFSGFDPINAQMLKEEILAQKSKGATIIFSTHNMASVEELCDDIALINESKVILSGAVNEIRRQYSTHTFEVGFTGHDGSMTSFLPDNYIIGQETADHGVRRTRITIPSGQKPNDLLKNLIDTVDIHSFEEVIPSMNDIFITAVTRQQPNVSTSAIL
jgi:ABC-2 type transport system ATP-binding protein